MMEGKGLEVSIWALMSPDNLLNPQLNIRGHCRLLGSLTNDDRNENVVDKVNSSPLAEG